MLPILQWLWKGLPLLACCPREKGQLFCNIASPWKKKQPSCSSWLEKSHSLFLALSLNLSLALTLLLSFSFPSPTSSLKESIISIVPIVGLSPVEACSQSTCIKKKGEQIWVAFTLASQLNQLVGSVGFVFCFFQCLIKTIEKGMLVCLWDWNKVADCTMLYGEASTLFLSLWFCALDPP